MTALNSKNVCNSLRRGVYHSNSDHLHSSWYHLFTNKYLKCFKIKNNKYHQTSHTRNQQNLSQQNLNQQNLTRNLNQRIYKPYLDQKETSIKSKTQLEEYIINSGLLDSILEIKTSNTQFNWKSYIRSKVYKDFLQENKEIGFSLRDIHFAVRSIFKKMLKNPIQIHHREAVAQLLKKFGYSAKDRILYDEIHKLTGLHRTQIYTLVHTEIDKYHRESISETQKSKSMALLEENLNNETQKDIIDMLIREVGVHSIQAKILLKTFLSKKDRKTLSQTDRLDIETYFSTFGQDKNISFSKIAKLFNASRSQIYELYRRFKINSLKISLSSLQREQIEKIYLEYKPYLLNSTKETNEIDLQESKSIDPRLYRKKMFDEMESITKIPRPILYQEVKKLENRILNPVTKKKIDLIKKLIQIYIDSGRDIDDSFYQEAMKKINLTKNQIIYQVFKLSQKKHNISLEQERQIMKNIDEFYNNLQKNYISEINESIQSFPKNSNDTNNSINESEHSKFTNESIKSKKINKTKNNNISLNLPSKREKTILYRFLEEKYQISKLQAYSFIRKYELSKREKIHFSLEEEDQIRNYLLKNLETSSRTIYSELSELLQVDRIQLYSIVGKLRRDIEDQKSQYQISQVYNQQINTIENNKLLIHTDEIASQSIQSSMNTQVVSDLKDLNTVPNSKRVLVQMNQRKIIGATIQEKIDTHSMSEIYDQLEKVTNIPRKQLYWLVRKFKTQMKS